MTAEIVKLHHGAALSDIPRQLRQLAEEIESGEYAEVDSLFVLMPVVADHPRVFGWGDVSGQNDPIIQLELAKAWFVNNLVQRR